MSFMEKKRDTAFSRPFPPKKSFAEKLQMYCYHSCGQWNEYPETVLLNLLAISGD